MTRNKIYSIIFPVVIVLSFINLIGENLFIHESDAEQIAVKTEIFAANKIDLDEVFSQKQLGSFVSNNSTCFRLFAPSAFLVYLNIYDSAESDKPESFEMKADDDGVWEILIDKDLSGKFYGYKVLHNKNDVIDQMPLCVDPYAKAVASFTSYNNPRKSIVFNHEYDWEDDTWIQRDWRDLIIYEMHIRDMTAHTSSGAKQPGTYMGLVERNITGGLNYIKELGVNTVELLPAMESGNCELPYMDSLTGKYNTWNPYERNHWGYMTSNFFAPSSYYAMKWNSFRWNEWTGTDGSQVNKFKDMVKAFHSEGIAVVMDVVYNHLSEYEVGNLKQIDREYYFRLDENRNYISQSGCGNDLKTERPMVRRMIVESILYWMKEYHIDGFRFDLGKLIDWETVEEITREARKVNPNVIIVCEPWGGGYDPKGFSLREWGSWNDQIRNGIKGENPFNGLGWIFGKWYGNNSLDRIKSYVNGTLVRYEHGLFQKAEHSVNYLESHDGYTLGDFIRIGTKEVPADEKIYNTDEHVKLTARQLRLNKLAALFLLTSQGITMIHSGQEFARSKVIETDNNVPDKNKGKMDHNSYEKDNTTNYVNYKHAGLNSDLLQYYKGLIKLRSTFESFRHSDPSHITFYTIKDDNFALGYHINRGKENFIIVFNANQEKEREFILPKGDWSVLVNADSAGIKPISYVNDKIILEPVTGMVLKKIK
ncbi:MAG: pullulanase [Melioribacteraceae bacterium]|nr:pullulanase [Melioribacteraceae bacterium]